MSIRPVLLWTDLAMWLCVAVIALHGLQVRRSPLLRAAWKKVFRDPAAMCAAIVLAACAGLALCDSLHFRRILALPANGVAEGTALATRTESVLDVLLARPLAMREASYSRPLAWQGFQKETIQRDGAIQRAYPRLEHGGRHLSDPPSQWRGDLAGRVAVGLVGAAGLAALLAGAGAVLAARRWGVPRLVAWRRIVAGDTAMPWRVGLLTGVALCVLAGQAISLGQGYHVLGTDRTGNDVLVQALKSLRTAFVIGILANLAMLPFAMAFGIAAGFFRGWVDELIQYVYTVLSSVPNVLLITASVLMVQVFLDTHPTAFPTGLERADLKILLLCLILGTTGWAGLCRLLRAETLKLRELDYVQAAVVLGARPWRIIRRHIVPNVMHLVVISVALEFSGLVLYEAVLSFLGVGVDPSTQSFGSMINLARSEMNRDPLVWWSFGAAFVLMVGVVLAANLFADGVREAFDPQGRPVTTRGRIRRRPHAVGR